MARRAVRAVKPRHRKHGRFRACYGAGTSRRDVPTFKLSHYLDNSRSVDFKLTHYPNLAGKIFYRTAPVWFHQASPMTAEATGDKLQQKLFSAECLLSRISQHSFGLITMLAFAYGERAS